jgi:hypothetical protein
MGTEPAGHIAIRYDEQQGQIFVNKPYSLLIDFVLYPLVLENS